MASSGPDVQESESASCLGCPPCRPCRSDGVVGTGIYMGDCQNYGPFLGPYYNTGPTTGLNLGDPKRAPYIYIYICGTPCNKQTEYVCSPYTQSMLCDPWTYAEL